MHSRKVVVEGTTFYVHHNSDWSGDVHIEGGGRSYSIPGAILLAVGAAAATNALGAAIVDLIEQWPPKTGA